MNRRTMFDRFQKMFNVASAYKALLTWINFVNARIHLRKRVNQVIKHLMHRKLSTCYRTWSNNVTEQIRLRVICQRIATRWLKASLVTCITKWSIYTCKRLEDKQIVQKCIPQF